MADLEVALGMRVRSMVRESKENMKTKKKQRQAKPQKKCCSTMNLTKIGDVLAEFGKWRDFQYESFLTGYFSALRVNSTEVLNLLISTSNFFMNPLITF